MSKIELRHEKADLGTLIRCYACGNEMRVRYSKKNKGYFFGCEKYPICRHTEPVDIINLLGQLRLAALYLYDIVEISKSPELQRCDYSAIERLTDLVDEIECYFFKEDTDQL